MSEMRTNENKLVMNEYLEVSVKSDLGGFAATATMHWGGQSSIPVPGLMRSN